MKQGWRRPTFSFDVLPSRQKQFGWNIIKSDVGKYLRCYYVNIYLCKWSVKFSTSCYHKPDGA